MLRNRASDSLTLRISLSPDSCDLVVPSSPSPAELHSALLPHLGSKSWKLGDRNPFLPALGRGGVETGYPFLHN